MIDLEVARNFAYACKSAIEGLARSAAVTEQEAQKIIFDVLDKDMYSGYSKRLS